eukprot:7647552-Alexandrium_andersonii.AAC.1
MLSLTRLALGLLLPRLPLLVPPGALAPPGSSSRWGTLGVHAGLASGVAPPREGPRGPDVCRAYRWLAGSSTHPWRPAAAFWRHCQIPGTRLRWKGRGWR